MRGFTKKIIFILNIIAGIALIASYFSSVISPAKFWPLAFLGLSYPFLLIINFLFLIFWAILRKFHFLLSMLCILAGLPFIRRIIQIENPFRDKTYYQQKYTPGSTSFKFITYNVRLFDLYEWEKEENTLDGIFHFIEREDPDIICFQEFYSRDKSMVSEEVIRQKLRRCKNSHIHYYLNKKKSGSHFGIATFSAYPIVGSGEIIFPNTFNICVYTDIQIGNDTIRVYNNHLQSVKLLKEDYGLIDTLKFKYNEKQMAGLGKIVIRVRDAFKMRSNQVTEVAAHIKQSPHPVIVCGDFNDSPVSYSYQTMLQDRKDAFIESGSGIGYTYRGKFPSYRIDYILYNPLLRSYEYQSPKLELSDHYPVICKFVLP